MADGFSYEVDTNDPTRITKIRGHELPEGVLHVPLDMPAESRTLDSDAVDTVAGIFEWAESIRDAPEAE